ncbi:hypothetical protein HpDR66_13590 [Helicobacter pylori]
MSNQNNNQENTIGLSQYLICKIIIKKSDADLSFFDFIQKLEKLQKMYMIKQSVCNVRNKRVTSYSILLHILHTKKKRFDMEQEELQPIDVKVLTQAYSHKTADKISKDLNIDYTNTLNISNKLKKKACAINGSLIKRKKKKQKNLKSNKPTKKRINNDHL